MTWSPEQDRILIEETAKNTRLGRIAAKLQMPEKTITSRRSHLRKMGRIPAVPRHVSPTARPQPDRDYQERKCLSCRQPFISEWVGNRVCDVCKRGRLWRGGSDYTMLGLR